MKVFFLPFLLATPLLAVPDPQHDSPTAEREGLKLAPGFEASLFASEADGVVKPIQMRFDARGRLWVIESTTYPQIKPGEVPNDKVLILEDTKHSGHVDKVTVFADGLMIPTGLELDGDGHGAWVGEGTKLWHFRDTKGDDHADVREVVLRGFGTGDAHQNINSFLWSPGGELMFSQGLHAFSHVETPYGTVALEEAGLWRYRPLTRRLDAFFGGKSDPQNPWGWAFTDWGQPFVVAGNNGAIFYPLPEMVRGHDQTRVGNIWLNPRVRKSSGPDIVGTAHLPPEWQGAFLTGGYMNSAVWALKIEEDGAGYRITDMPPLITSAHTSFRPIDVKIGPDGAIYLCDWYNPIVGHYQASFRHPDRDKTHGRIWRVTATGRPLVQQPPIVGASIPQLLQNLGSGERWTRQQSKRMLSSFQAREVLPALAQWVSGFDPQASATEHLRYEALGLYETFETPEPALLAQLLQAREPNARAYAAGVVARWADRLPNSLELLRPLAHDEHPRVRMAAVVAAGNISQAASLEVALGVTSHPMDRFTDEALHQAVVALKPQWLPQLTADHLNFSPEAWMALAKADATADTARVLRKLLDEATLSPAQREPLLQTLADVGTAEDLGVLLRPATYRSDTALEARTLAGLVRSMKARHVKPAGDLASLLPVQAGQPPALRAEALRLAGLYHLPGLLPELQVATAAAEPLEVRLGAIEGLSALGGTPAQQLLTKLAQEAEPVGIRVAAVHGLATLDLHGAAQSAAALLTHEVSPETAGGLLSAFLQRKEGAHALAAALGEQKPLRSAAELALNQLWALGRQDAELVAALSASIGVAKEPLHATPEFVAKLVAEVRESGDAKRGEAIFHSARVACTSCHSVGGTGGIIGPSLDAIGAGQPLDFIIGAVLEPQREVKEGYEAIEVTTLDGRVVQGYRVRDADGETVLRDVMTGAETHLRREIVAQKREIGSLMPPGLVDGLTRQELRDLFRYLSELGKPKL